MVHTRMKLEVKGTKRSINKKQIIWTFHHFIYLHVDSNNNVTHAYKWKAICITYSGHYLDLDIDVTFMHIGYRTVINTPAWAQIGNAHLWFIWPPVDITTVLVTWITL